MPGGYVGWAGTASADPNPWVTFGEIIANNILLFDMTQASGPNFTLTETQAAHRVIQTPTGFSGSPAKPPSAPEPNTIWRIIHNQSGQDLTVKATNADTPELIVATNLSSMLWSDGTSFFKLS